MPTATPTPLSAVLALPNSAVGCATSTVPSTAQGSARSTTRGVGSDSTAPLIMATITGARNASTAASPTGSSVTAQYSELTAPKPSRPRNSKSAFLRAA